MKNILIIAFLLSALFISACENNQTTQNSNNNQQNETILAKTKNKQVSLKRHVTVKSENSFDETYKALKKAIESKEALTIIAELDHSKNAKKADMELPPTKVIMFGNPKLGTPLMKANREIGIDLPQKMLVYEDENNDVFVVYSDPKIIAENHKLKGQDEVLGKILEALSGLAEAATKKKDK